MKSTKTVLKALAAGVLFSLLMTGTALAYAIDLTLVDYDTEAWVLLADNSGGAVDDGAYDLNPAVAGVNVDDANWAHARVELGTTDQSGQSTAWYQHDLDYTVSTDYTLFKNLYSRGTWELTLTPDTGETGTREIGVSHQVPQSGDYLWWLYNPAVTNDPETDPTWLLSAPGPDYTPGTVYLEIGTTYLLESFHSYVGGASLTFTGQSGAAPTPEPATVVLLGLAMGGFLYAGRRGLRNRP